MFLTQILLILAEEILEAFYKTTSIAKCTSDNPCFLKAYEGHVIKGKFLYSPSDVKFTYSLDTEPGFLEKKMKNLSVGSENRNINDCCKNCSTNVLQLPIFITRNGFIETIATVYEKDIETRKIFKIPVNGGFVLAKKNSEGKFTDFFVLTDNKFGNVRIESDSNVQSNPKTDSQKNYKLSYSDFKTNSTAIGVAFEPHLAVDLLENLQENTKKSDLTFYFDSKSDNLLENFNIPDSFENDLPMDLLPMILGNLTEELLFSSFQSRRYTGIQEKDGETHFFIVAMTIKDGRFSELKTVTTSKKNTEKKDTGKKEADKKEADKKEADKKRASSVVSSSKDDVTEEDSNFLIVIGGLVIIVAIGIAVYFFIIKK